MIYVILVLFLFVVGLLMGWLAGLIWRSDRPYGLLGDLGISSVNHLCRGINGLVFDPGSGIQQQSEVYGRCH